MGMHEDRMKAMRFEGPERIPIACHFLPATWRKYRENLDEIVARHPEIFGPAAEGDRDYDAVSGTYVMGDHVDAWGCVWSNIQEGCEAIVTGHPVPTREDINSLEPPEPGAGTPHGFMWLRLGDLRGFEELMVDFAEEPPELQRLIDIVRDYNRGEVQRMLAGFNGNRPDMMYFGDDLGMQTALPISPPKWRKYLKPAFAAIYAPVKEKGIAVYMHTDGHILPIIPDLVDCGVNVVNPQIRANGLQGLVDVCKGKVCVDLDLDRQLFPFATPQQVDDHIKECVTELGS
ncbi:MAG: hypothetical protein GF320_20605, partial [Armatimonadia bacterium]|nr:hypothetical protein [Armatimonadia bacterium]